MDPDPFVQALPQNTVFPDVLAALHGNGCVFSGECTVVCGQGWLVALALRVGGFPRRSGKALMTLEVSRCAQSWVWERRFDGHVTRSVIKYDPELSCVRERVNGVVLWLKPVFQDAELAVSIKRVTVFGMPVPKKLMPRATTAEWQGEDGTLHFDIRASLPVLGDLIRYHGRLTQVHENGESG